MKKLFIFLFALIMLTSCVETQDVQKSLREQYPAAIIYDIPDSYYYLLISDDSVFIAKAYSCNDSTVEFATEKLVLMDSIVKFGGFQNPQKEQKDTTETSSGYLW